MTIENVEVQEIERPRAQAWAGVFMVALGVLGMYFSIRQNAMYARTPRFPELIFTYGPLGFVAAVGLWGLVLAVRGWDSGEVSLPGFLRAYQDAWRKMTGLRWLLIIAGVVSAVNILGAVIEIAVESHFLADRLEWFSQNTGLPAMLTILKGKPILANMLSSLPGLAGRSLSDFFPKPGIHRSGGTAAVMSL